MPNPLTLGAVWVIVAAITAMLPMRRQAILGLPLLIAAPVLLVWIGMIHGVLAVAFGTFAFLSMFRRPLNYFARKALGRTAPRTASKIGLTHDP